MKMALTMNGYTTTEEQELYDDAVPADKQANLSSSKPAARLNIQNKPPPPGKPVFLTKKTGFPEKPTTEGTKTSQSSSVSELKARLEKMGGVNLSTPPGKPFVASKKPFTISSTTLAKGSVESQAVIKSPASDQSKEPPRPPAKPLKVLDNSTNNNNNNNNMVQELKEHLPRQQLRDELPSSQSSYPKLVGRDGREYKKLSFYMKVKTQQVPQSLLIVDLPVISTDGAEPAAEPDKQLRGNRGRRQEDGERVSLIESYAEEDELKEIGPAPTNHNSIKESLSSLPSAEEEEEYNSVEVDQPPNEELPPKLPSRPRDLPKPPVQDTVGSEDAEKKAKQKEKERRKLELEQKKREKEKEKQRIKEHEDKTKLQKKYKITDDEMFSSHILKATCNITTTKNLHLSVKANESLFLIKRVENDKWMVAKNRAGVVGLVEASKVIDTEAPTKPTVTEAVNHDHDDDSQELYEEI